MKNGGVAMTKEEHSFALGESVAWQTGTTTVGTIMETL